MSHPRMGSCNYVQTCSKSSAPNPVSTISNIVTVSHQTAYVPCYCYLLHMSFHSVAVLLYISNKQDYK